jgi:V-type H+-transporting ATPase subunit a
MGFYAVYAGFIYNDCFSLGLNLFGSRWVFANQDYGTVNEGDVATSVAEYGSNESVYPFGLDPVWHVSGNELLFFNSFKMKMSVVFGICQMFLGTCIKGLNAIHFGEKLDLYFEVVPMMVFASLFIYMPILIIMKWSIDWEARMLSATCFDPSGDQWQQDWTMCDTSQGNGYCLPNGNYCEDGFTTVDKCPLGYGGTGDGCQPPVLITTLINIALQPGAVDEPMFQGQALVQNVLLFFALCSIPVLLLGKPLFLRQQSHPPVVHHTEELPLYTDDHNHSSTSTSSNGHGDEEEHNFSEVIIHQGIETIEFTLGMVSNTASYLRLWALSLAHSELATVFWEKCMLDTLNMDSFIYCFFGFTIFAGATFGVLLMMDVLECYLHALRLHWVEFQSKFYKGDGIRFVPYAFKQVIKDSAL